MSCTLVQQIISKFPNIGLEYGLHSFTHMIVHVHNIIIMCVNIREYRLRWRGHHKGLKSHKLSYPYMYMYIIIEMSRQISNNCGYTTFPRNPAAPQHSAALEISPCVSGSTSPPLKSHQMVKDWRLYIHARALYMRTNRLIEAVFTQMSCACWSL